MGSVFSGAEKRSTRLEVEISAHETVAEEKKGGLSIAKRENLGKSSKGKRRNRSLPVL